MIKVTLDLNTWSNWLLNGSKLVEFLLLRAWNGTAKSFWYALADWKTEATPLAVHSFRFVLCFVECIENIAKSFWFHADSGVLNW